MDRNYEEEASRQGWKPEGELDAQAFVEKGEKIAGILKNKNERLENRIQSLESSNKEFGEYQKKQQDKLKNENARLLSELEAQRATAITDGDGQAFTRLDREIDHVKQGLQESLPPNGNAQFDQMANAWAQSNPWYATDNILRAYADGISTQIDQEGWTGQSRFDEITRRTEEQFPQKFGNPNQNRQTSVEESGKQIETVESKNAKTYGNLPKDAKASCDRFVADGFMSKEDFVSAYEWE